MSRTRRLHVLAVVEQAPVGGAAAREVRGGVRRGELRVSGAVLAGLDAQVRDDGRVGEVVVDELLRVGRRRRARPRRSPGRRARSGRARGRSSSFLRSRFAVATRTSETFGAALVSIGIASTLSCAVELLPLRRQAWTIRSLPIAAKPEATSLGAAVGGAGHEAVVARVDDGEVPVTARGGQARHDLAARGHGDALLRDSGAAARAGRARLVDRAGRRRRSATAVPPPTPARRRPALPAQPPARSTCLTS